MSKYKKLINNSFIFALGNLGTKLIVFFLIPLYTYYLTTSEFGLVDLLTTTISLLIPLITLSVFDSVLRFVMDKNYDKSSVLINAIVVAIIGNALLLSIYPILLLILPFHGMLLYFYLLLLLQSVNSIFMQYIRAKGFIKLFAVSGIVNAFTLLFANIVFLVIYNMGIEGYLFSLIIASIVSSLFIFIMGELWSDLQLCKINIKLAKEMLKYSIPLIPNALMWWIMGFSDRYIITYYLGLSATGLYAVATKIPSILIIINSIFFQAWQMSAIEEVNSKEKSKFFSDVFNIFSCVMLLSTSFILLHLKLFMDILFADSFSKSWEYVPFLLLGVVFSSFSGFLGTNYIAVKKTVGVFKTSIIGAVINVFLNIILIPVVGAIGAAIATMFSFAIIWLLRVKDTKKFVSIKLNIKKLLLTIIVIKVQILVLYLGFSYEYLIQVCLFFIILLINLNEIKLLIKKIREVIGSRLNVVKKIR